MNIILLGAAGFIGTNLTLSLVENVDNKITLIDEKKEYFSDIVQKDFKNVLIRELQINEETNFEKMLVEQDVVYHLVSTTVPTTSNQHIAQELIANVVMTSKLLDACVTCGVKKMVFVSSGGTVYGQEIACPLKENSATNPISSYGVQKVTIEKLLYLYRYMYGLDYRVVRLANPYGPYQRPNGILGAVTTFTYKALKHEVIEVYGDGSVIRDFIYISDAVRAIIKIAEGEAKHRIFNLGCGYGTSITHMLEIIQDVLDIKLDIKYSPARKVDVPVNYLDISRYEEIYGQFNPLPLREGIIKTAAYIREKYILSP